MTVRWSASTSATRPTPRVQLWPGARMFIWCKPASTSFRFAQAHSIKCLMPILFPVTEVAFRIPRLGRVFSFAIPVANYVNESELSLRQRYQWALLDTFDMLSPQYDQPQTEKAATAALRAEGVVDIERLPTGGLNLVGRKAS